MSLRQHRSAVEKKLASHGHVQFERDLHSGSWLHLVFALVLYYVMIPKKGTIKALIFHGPGPSHAARISAQPGGSDLDFGRAAQRAGWVLALDLTMDFRWIFT